MGQSPDDGEPGGSGSDLIFTCSGAADVAEIGHQAARQLSAQGTGSMFCLAGIGGRVPAHLQRTRQARRILVIDGCKVGCARRTLELAGFTSLVELRVTSLGLDKGQSPPTPERVQRVAEYAARLLQA